MNGYFTRLAAKAVDPGEALQPRLPSRFETPVFAEAPETADSLPGPVRAEGNFRGVARPRDVDSSPRRSPPPATGHTAAPETSDSLASQPEEFRSEAALTFLDTPRHAAPLLETPALALAPAHYRSREIQPSAQRVSAAPAAAPALPMPRDSWYQQAPLLATENEPARQGGQGLAFRPQPEIETRLHSSPERAKVASIKPEAPSLDATLRPAIPPRQNRGMDPAPRRAFESTRDADSDTVVHVTIGRIEVRAAGPPQSPVKQARPAPVPKMTLEEYLAKSSGGSR